MSPWRTHPDDPGVSEVCERLRAEGVDVVRVSYPDLIGVDRGRDVLLDVLPSAMEHGLAFCRAVYHTSPMGDVVPVQGGLEAGLPDIHVFPDLSSLTALPWEPNAAWCIGEAFTPDGAPAPEAPRTVARRVADRIAGAGLRAGLRSRARVLPVPAGAGRPAGGATPTTRATSTWSAARATRRACCCTCSGSYATPGCR